MNVWNIIEAISIFAMFACIVVLAVINERLRRALEWELEKNTRRIRVEQILKEEAKKPPCILRQACPSGCEFYKPKEESDEG